MVLLWIGLMAGTSSATVGQAEPQLADGGSSTQGHCGNNPESNLVCFVLDLLPNAPLGRGGGT